MHWTSKLCWHKVSIFQIFTAHWLAMVENLLDILEVLSISCCQDKTHFIKFPCMREKYVFMHWASNLCLYKINIFQILTAHWLWIVKNLFYILQALSISLCQTGLILWNFLTWGKRCLFYVPVNSSWMHPSGNTRENISVSESRPPGQLLV